MWNKKEDQEAGTLAKPAPGGYAVPGGRPEPSRSAAPMGGTALIGKSVLIKGELSGSEDIYLDGTVEGSIELRGNNLTVGPNGRVRAGIRARGVIIEGKVDGDIEASERVELRKTAVLAGNIVTQRVAIEDGAYFKGGVDVNRQAATQPRPEVKQETSAASASAASGSGAQPRPVMEHKKS